jgi:hypothetical protein
MPLASNSEANPLETLSRTNALFRGLELSWLANYLPADQLIREKLYSNRPVYTAFKPKVWLDVLYAVVEGGPVIIRSSPLDRIIAISYAGSCFGMRSLPLGLSQAGRGFPSQVEAYKTTNVIKIPLESLRTLYGESAEFRDRYNHLLELREKFQYHLLNCSAYPPQAVAALLRALIYQERELGNQPNVDGTYSFDLPIDIIARATQLNHRTVEQVLKAMQKVQLLAATKSSEPGDTLRVTDPEGLKETYSATRDKVSWWPLK